jgi:hypothetical protein
MVSEDVLRYLVIACRQLDNAKFAGSPRYAIAEAYSAVDSCFSALLVDAGQVPPRNHKDKLDSVRKLDTHILDGYQEATPGGGTLVASGVSWARVETFYQDWLAARYAEFSARPTDARVRCVEGHRVFGFVIRSVAKKHAIAPMEFEDKVRTSAFGYLFSETDVATSDVNERRAEEAERYGEMYGAPLGTRLAETSNYCALAITAGDALTQRIIETDGLIAEECSEFYEHFIRLVEHIQDRRRRALTPTDPKATERREPDETPDFMLALKMSFCGQKVSELAGEFAQLLGLAPK